MQCISDRCIKKFCKATHDPIVAPTTQRLAKPATPGAARSERSKYRRRSMHSASAEGHAAFHSAVSLERPKHPRSARRHIYRRRSMHSASARRPCRLPQRRLPRTAKASAFSTATYIQETFHARRKRPKAMPPSTAPSPSNGQSIRVQHGDIYTRDVPCTTQAPEGHAAFHSAVSLERPKHPRSARRHIYGRRSMHSASARRPCRLSQRRLP